MSTEDILAAQMAARAKDTGITYVALTATPKAKTLELFGRRPDSSQPVGPTNLPQAFHVYSMRQAIEEGFILDVLKNYTAYKMAFRLAHSGRDYDETEVEREAALKGIMRWVRLHPYNIAQKVQIVVEHFRENVMPLLEGRAKAMVVVGSRVEAVRWKLAIEGYIQTHGYPIGILAAFSGEVRDSESGPEPFTEKSANLNPGLKGRDIRDAFDTAEYQILLVANKFQTGFDQPLLCGMYVDKRLSGIQAVQTLSRLNRAYPGKDTTYILDFVNDPDEVLASFQPYYETAELAGVTDPDLVYTLRALLDGTGYYDENAVNRVAEVELDPNAKQSELVAAIHPVADRLLKQYQEARKRLLQAQSLDDSDGEQKARDEMDALVLFRRNMGTYVRVYAFLSQIFDYGNTEIEKRAIFFRRLIPLLEFEREREEVDLSKVKLTHHSLRHTGNRQLKLGGETGKLQPLQEAGSGEVHPKEKAFLREIIRAVNELFEGDVTEDDKLVYVDTVKTKLMESEILVQQARNNTKEQFADSPDLHQAVMSAIMDALSAHSTLSKQALDSAEVRAGLTRILLGPASLYEHLRAQDRPGEAPT